MRKCIFCTFLIAQLVSCASTQLNDNSVTEKLTDKNTSVVQNKVEKFYDTEMNLVREVETDTKIIQKELGEENVQNSITQETKENNIFSGICSKVAFAFAVSIIVIVLCVSIYGASKIGLWTFLKNFLKVK